MTGPLKNRWLISSILISLIGCADSTRPVATSQKTSVSKPKKTTQKAGSKRPKSIAQQKAEFLRWLNEPGMNDIAHTARKVLRWKIYGAVYCGKINSRDGEPTQTDAEYQKIIKPAVELFKMKKAFYFNSLVEAYRENMPTEGPMDYVVDERAIYGTHDGQIYEFWLDHSKLVNPWTFVYSHRKWKKPTVQKKGSTILFFDAAYSDSVRRTRLKLGMNQQEMATALGCALSSVARMEQLGKLPSKGAVSNNFEKLAYRAGVSIP